ncbi:MAG: hypothetical protein ACRCZO_01550, partial [Cetobacterium sp.]
FPYRQYRNAGGVYANWSFTSLLGCSTGSGLFANSRNIWKSTISHLKGKKESIHCGDYAQNWMQLRV